MTKEELLAKMDHVLAILHEQDVTGTIRLLDDLLKAVSETDLTDVTRLLIEDNLMKAKERALEEISESNPQ